MRVTTVGAECESQGQPQLAHHATKLHQNMRELTTKACGKQWAEVELEVRQAAVVSQETDSAQTSESAQAD